jgi:peptide/nickel transport system substrate-binding protein
MELKIREGVKFQNGDPMTVDDVVFSLDRIINAKTYPLYLARKRDTLPNMASIEAIDDHTVRITTTKPEPLFEVLLNTQQTAIVPKKYIMGLSGDPNAIEDSDYDAFGLKPVGTGPYRIAEYVPNEKLVYERFDGYWGDKAPFARIEITRVPELSARITALKSGEVDLITNVPPDQLDTIASDSSLKVEGMQTPIFHVIIYNTSNPEMADPKLRQALSLAVDRDTLNQALWFGKAKVPSTHTFEQFGDLYMPELQTFRYDPEEAKRLLAQSNYHGQTLKYDLHAGYYTNEMLVGQALQEMWANIGVKVDLNVTEEWTGAKPEMEIRSWSNPMYYSDPAGAFGVMWGPTGNSVGEKRFSPSEAYVKTWDRFRYSTDLSERKKAYSELMQMIADDPPVLPLYQPYESYGMKANLNWKPQVGTIPYVLLFRAGYASLGD